ncbi:hypothetical protein [Streptomyces kronopolitis]
MDGEADLCADSFVLDEVGCGLLSALRDWARDSPTTAVPGIARSIIRFVVSVIPDPDHEDTADTLEALRDARLAVLTRCTPYPMPTADRAIAPLHRCGGAHPPGAHRCGGARTTSTWCAPPSIRCASTRWAVRAPVRSARGSGAHRVGSVRWSGPEWRRCVSP